MKTIALFFACTALFLAGCSDNANPYGSGGSSGGGSNPPPNTVQMLASSFSPANLTVSVGTTVTWKNVDGAIHTSTSDSSGLWNTGDVKPDSIKTTTFNTAGTFRYHCIYHRAMGMVGTITVQ